MKETKILNGTMNLDDSIESQDGRDYGKAFNYRSEGTDQLDANYGTNIEASLTVTPTGQRHSGINTGIGVGKFPKIKKAYQVYKNTGGYHQLTELDTTTRVETVIFEDKTDTGGVNIFDLSPDSFFCDIKMQHDTFLLMTEGLSGMIYCINIERLKSGGYGNPIQKESFNLLKAQPLKPIKTAYVDDPIKNANLLKSKLFQFRARFGYDDYVKSSVGTMSERPTPELEMTDAVGDNPNKNNGIRLAVDIGDSLVKDLDVLVRDGLNDWRVIKTITRTEILSLPDIDIDIPNEIREAYNASTNEYIMVFYNEGFGEVLPATLTDEPYDRVPNNAGALEIINGDIIALADIEEGYDKPNTTIELSVSTYLPDLETEVTNPRNFNVTGSDERIRGTHQRYVFIDITGTPKTGDRVIINLGNISSTDITNQIVYTVTVSDSNNMNSLIENLYNQIPSAYISPNYAGFVKKRHTYDNTHGSIWFVTESYIELKAAYKLLNQTGSVEGKTIGTVKGNTSYQAAIAHFDRHGKYLPLATGKDNSKTTPSYAASLGQIPQLGWKLTGTPPPEAVSAQVLLSENTKYLKQLYVTGAYDATESKDDFIAINLASLARYVIEKEGSVVNWDFAVGDRVSLQYTFKDTSAPIKWFNNPPLDFAIQDIEIKTETSGSVVTTKHLLKIKKSDLLPEADLAGNEILLELYTLKESNLDEDTKVYFEIAEEIPIVDGQYTRTSGVITRADSYFRPRKFVSNLDPNIIFALPVEDFNFSDSYQSKFWSAGRGRTLKDEVGKVRLSASIRFSDTFPKGTKLNNSNKFYTNNIYGDNPAETNSLHGAISKLVLRQGYLIVLQEQSIAHVPVYKTLIESVEGQQSIAISDKLFGNANYISAYGTGGAKRVITVADTGVVYFLDINKGYPCRDGFDGVKKINDKMTKYFNTKLKGLEALKTIGYFNDFMSEWHITFPELSEEVVTLSFTDDNYEYKDSYTKTINEVMLIQPSHGSLTIDGNNLVYTPTNGYFGNDSLGISFTQGTETIVKNACGIVKEAITTVTQFSFIDLYGQEPNTLAISNQVTASGITISVPINLSVGGEYRVNGGAWTSAAATVSPDANVEVRVTTPANYGGFSSTTLTMGGTSATFTAHNKFGNAAKNQVFKRQCSGNQVGSNVTYTIPANKWTANTQQAADDLATQDMTDNGQAFANDPANGGTCTTPVKYIWGKLSYESPVVNSGSGITTTRAFIVLRTYLGNSATVPPSLTTPHVCTNGSIPIDFVNLSYPESSSYFNASMSNQSSKVLSIPNFPPDGSGRSAIQVNDEVYRTTFRNKAEGEMVLLQTI